MKKLSFPILLVTLLQFFQCFPGPVYADVKISQLPLGSAASTTTNDSFAYVNSTASETERLTLWDLINLPPMVSTYAPIASPTFTGTVTAPTIVLSSGATEGYCWTATNSSGAGEWESCSGGGGGSGTVTSVGLSVPSWLTVSGSPITTSGTLAVTGTSETGNYFLAAPNGSSGAMTPRAIVGADLPNPSSDSLGGVESYASVSHQWINSISTSGVPSSSQPSFSDISGTLGVSDGGTGATSFTSDHPLIGNGTSAVSTGSVSGNTTTFATTDGTLNSGDCVDIDANGNLVDAGAACGSGGGGSPGGSSSDVQYNSSGSFAGDSSFTYNGSGTVTATTFVGALTGNASTATALASSPSACSGNDWATGIATDGDASCSQPGFSNLSGKASASQGGMGIDTSSSTGMPSVSSGTWSISSLATTFVNLYETVATTAGDLIYGGSSGTPTRLPIGTAGQILTVNSGGTAPQWSNNGSVTAPVIQTYTYSGVTTVTSATISSSSECISSITGSIANVYAGMGIVDTTTNSAITKGTYVYAIPGTCSSGQIQMSADAADSETSQALTFGPMTSITDATISTSSECITNTAAPYGVVVGAPIYDLTHSTAITAGTTVAGIGTGSCSAGYIEMSADAASSESETENIVFGQVYDAPSSPSALYLEVKMVGGGGGGSGAGTSTNAAGTNGTPSLFGSSLIEMGGGAGGEAVSGGSGTGGPGGTPSVATGVMGLIDYGNSGQSGINTTNSTVYGIGGNGGAAPLFGGGTYGGSNSTIGQEAPANSGSGGGGGGASTGVAAGSGGGSGAACDVILSGAQLSDSFPILIGEGGDGGSQGSGTGASAGGEGANGNAIIVAHFQ